jgi:hypothetical protein
MYCADYGVTTIALNYNLTTDSEEHYWQWTKHGAVLASCYCTPASIIIKGVLQHGQR